MLTGRAFPLCIYALTAKNTLYTYTLRHLFLAYHVYKGQLIYVEIPGHVCI